MAVFPSATYDDRISSYILTTVGAGITSMIPVKSIIWYATSSVASTFVLQLDETTASGISTAHVSRVVGPAQAGTTAAVGGQLPTAQVFPINRWVSGVYVTTLTAGIVQVIPAQRNGTGYEF